MIKKMYEITPYTRKQARRLGVEVKPSTDRTKKIDVYRKGKRVASVGGAGYSDYPTYIRTKGKAYADRRRKEYKRRHRRDRLKRNTNGYYADQLLW